MAPQLIFGTASFGMDLSEFQNAESVNGLLDTLDEMGIHRLDTAARYPPLNQGRSEQLIGEAKAKSSAFLIDTKVYTSTATDGSGDLTRESVQKSVESSLKRLQRAEGVNVLYAHRPDPQTPLEEQIQAFNEQIAQGRCRSWGVSNMPPATLQKVVDLCEKNGWPKPGCYQGTYSLITRGMESKLLPTLRAHGIRFVAYQVLAVGFLTGKLVNNEHADTRFGDNNPLGKHVRRAFEADDLTNAMRKFDSDVKERGLTPLEVAIRWVVHHSALGDDDAVILGASKAAQVKETVAMTRKGPLPDEFVMLAEELWAAVKPTRDGIQLGQQSSRGFDPSRVAVSGFSAGAQLALVAASALRKEASLAGLLTVVAVVAHYPETDLSAEPETKTVPSPIRPHPPAMLRFFHDAFVPDESLRADPKVSPSKADAADFPPYVIMLTASGDIFSPEAVELAAKLKEEEEVDDGRRRTVVLKTLKGVHHGFDKGARRGTREWARREEAYEAVVRSLKDALNV